MILDNFKPIKVMTEQEVKEELYNLRQKQVLKTTAAVTGATVIIKISPIVDDIAFTTIANIKAYMSSSYYFMGLVHIPNYYFIILLFAFLVYGYGKLSSEISKEEKEHKK